MQDDPVQSLDFWRGRIDKFLVKGQRPLHAVIYDCEAQTWAWCQLEAKRIISEHIRPGESVLDAACGFGALSEVMPQGVTYLGVDISPELIALARNTYPSQKFMVWDLNQPLNSEFDWAVARGVKHMFTVRNRESEWLSIYNQLAQKVKRMLVLDYAVVGEPVHQEVLHCRS